MLSSGLRISLLLLLRLLTAMELIWSLTEEDKKLLVDLHNQYRSQVSPPAADMLKMSWDPELETFAQNYSTKCIWEHNEEHGERGENLFTMTAGLTRESSGMSEKEIEKAVEVWYKELVDYNMTTLTCTEGKMCGHYTQVVWAKSEYLGCGVQLCNTLKNLNTTTAMHFLVCNYKPPGNFEGEVPYQEGSPCSKCPADYTCEDSLCVRGPTTIAPLPTELESTATVIASSQPISITPGPGSTISESPKSITEAEPESPTAKGLTSSLEPTSDLDLETSPELLTKGTDASLATGFTPLMNLDLALSPASPEMGTAQVFYSEPPSTDGLISSEATTRISDAPPSTDGLISSEATTRISVTPPSTDGLISSEATTRISEVPPSTDGLISSEATTVISEASPSTDGLISSEATTRISEPPPSTDGLISSEATTRISEPPPSTDGLISSEATTRISEPPPSTDGLISSEATTRISEPPPSTDGLISSEATTVISEAPPSTDGLISSEATTRISVAPPTTVEPVHSSTKAPPTTKLPFTPKTTPPPKRPSPLKPPSGPKPPSPLKPPSRPKLPSPLKPPSPPKPIPISKSPARHRLAAYSKALKRLNHAAQTTSGKEAHLSVCLPCLGCKQISHPEEIKTALDELTFRYPYASCFSPLPRWRRHSKCKWCGRTWSHALTRASPYWLKSL